MDSIILEGIAANGRHGALPGEREEPQPFEVDVRLHLDLSAPSRSDSLTDTVDYAEIAELVATEVERTSYNLIESLAEQIARAVLALDSRIAEVEIEVTKLSPQMPRAIGRVAVRLERRR